MANAQHSPVSLSFSKASLSVRDASPTTVAHLVKFPEVYAELHDVGLADLVLLLARRVLVVRRVGVLVPQVHLPQCRAVLSGTQQRYTSPQSLSFRYRHS